MHSGAHYSALSSWVLLIAKAIESYGLDSRKMFMDAGLDHARLRDPLARFSYPAVRKLWRLASEASNDSCFGLTVASFWHPTTLHALGYSWLASDNLAEAFTRLVRYTRIVNTAAGGVFKIEQDAGCYKLVTDQNEFQFQPIPAAADAGLAMILIMCRSAYGESFQPLCIKFRHEPPQDLERFESMIGAPAEFDQDNYELWMDPQVINEPLATANPELVRINDQIVTDYLAQIDRTDIVNQVRSRLIERLPQGQIAEDQIASALHLSSRSLQRKLRAQGVTFKRLLDDTRRELARQYVRNSQHSLIEIAFLLGFTEPGNFTRAFKRWNGVSPSQYRQDLLA